MLKERLRNNIELKKTLYSGMYNYGKYFNKLMYMNNELKLKGKETWKILDTRQLGIALYVH